MTGELRRENWIVPVPGLTPTDPDGTVQAIARRDGTVVLHLIRGTSRSEVRLDVCQAAQLCTGIWEAAGAAQQLTAYFDDGQHPPAQPPRGPEDLPQDWRSPSRRSVPARSAPAPDRAAHDRAPSTRRRLPPTDEGPAWDASRTIGLRIRRIRKARDKSLRVISGLAGMSRSTLHRAEHGQRELTLSEIMALATALKVTSAELIPLPILAPTDSGDR